MGRHAHSAPPVIDEWHDTTSPATARMSRMVPTNVGSTSGVPEIADDLSHRASRQKIRSGTPSS
jgi:hypothetical protein